jgi:hypothetical protein
VTAWGVLDGTSKGARTVAARGLEQLERQQHEDEDRDPGRQTVDRWQPKDWGVTTAAIQTERW